METNRLVQFRTVVETSNLRRAAEILGISHSGLSKSMKTLEDELGLVLFQTSGRGIVISDDGAKIYERSKRLLEEVQQFLGDRTQSRAEALRLGSFEVFTSFFIGPLLKTYLPDAEVEVHELIPGRLEEALVNRRVDIGITYDPVPRQGVEYVKATTVVMGAFGLTGVFGNTAIEQVPFIVPVLPLEGLPTGVKGRDAWLDEKIERRVKYRVDLLGTGLELARQGLAAIFIPKFVAYLHNERSPASRRLEPLVLPRGMSSIKRDVFIVKRESSPEDKTMRQIARALREVCALGDK